MASQPPTISKTIMFWSSALWSWRHNVGARELSANHVAHGKAWQARAGNAVDMFWDWLSSRCNGCRMAKSYRQKYSNYIQIEAIHPQSYRQLVLEGIKISSRHNSSWNSALFYLKSSGPLNCTFTKACWSHQVEMKNFLANMSWILHNQVTWQ